MILYYLYEIISQLHLKMSHFRVFFPIAILFTIFFQLFLGVFAFTAYFQMEIKPFTTNLAQQLVSVPCCIIMQIFLATLSFFFMGFLVLLKNDNGINNTLSFTLKLLLGLIFIFQIVTAVLTRIFYATMEWMGDHIFLSGSPFQLEKKIMSVETKMQIGFSILMIPLFSLFLWSKNKKSIQQPNKEVSPTLPTLQNYMEGTSV